MARDFSRREFSKATAALLSLGLAGQQKAQAAFSGPIVKATIVFATPAFYDLPLFALTKVGDEFGLHADSLELQGGGDGGAVFAGGSGDVLNVGMDKAFGFHASGIADIKVFAVLVKSAMWSLVVQKNSTINSLKDLKGKTVGITGPGSGTEMLMNWAFRKEGLEPSRDVELISLGSLANLYAAIEHGRVTASLLAAPVLQRAVDENIVRVIANYEDLKYPNSVLIARTKDLKENSQKFTRFRSAFKTMLERFRDDRPFALKIARLRYPNASDDDLSKQLDHAIAKFWTPMDGKMTRELYDQGRSILVGSGRLKESQIGSYEDLVIDLPDA